MNDRVTSRIRRKWKPGDPSVPAVLAYDSTRNSDFDFH